MRVEHSLACRRPHEYSSQIQPMIPVALHGTLPSGHATEASTFAYVLWILLRDSGRKELWGEQLMRQASRIAVNRTVAGVHFPVDSVAGAMLGLTLGQYLVARCKAASSYTAWKFDRHEIQRRLQLARDVRCWKRPEGSQDRGGYPIHVR